MSDLTPPPEEPLPDQARARIRAELLEVAQSGTPARRWLVPAVAAAAVVLVVGTAAWAVQRGPGDGGAAPAGAASSTPAATSTSPSAPAKSLIPPPSVSPTDPVPSTTGPTGVRQAGSGDCRQELRYPFPGAEMAAAFGDDTSFWVKGDRFALCDVRGGVTTVHRPLPLTPDGRVDDYRVSSAYTADGRVTRVAGGIVPDGATAFDVRYTFPDRATVRAETVQGGGHTWWRVVHSYVSRGNEMKQPPIEVTVSYSGVRQHYTLDWATDTCAQVNHGC